MAGIGEYADVKRRMRMPMVTVWDKEAGTNAAGLGGGLDQIRAGCPRSLTDQPA